MTRKEKAIDGLWAHQRQAVDMARSYLAEPNVGDESALITMPTGTGKTGVIAAITTCLPEVKGHRLVLTPWVALVKQSINDLRGRFWDRLPERSRPSLMPVRRLPPSSQLHTLKTADPTIYVATIAAISVAADTEGLDLAPAFSGFGCVVVDEGHYEPAPNWSEAIRGLRRPTILLTATPYRNDQKLFNVGDRWRYRFAHHAAENKLYLRKPDFDDDVPASTSPRAFAKHVIDKVDETFAAPQDVRVIVRCATAPRIKEMVRAVRALGESVVGVHERFRPDEDPDLRRVVPGTDHPARFWIHQNKLIEGIDDPRFKVLAFYESLTNARAIVQQIGRVLRNPSRDSSDMTALIISRGDRNIKHTWDEYWRFDNQDEAESVATLPGLLELIVKSQQTFYLDGSYRSPIDLSTPKPWKDFAFPLRTRVFRSSDGVAPSLDALQDAIMREYKLLDRKVYVTEAPDKRTRIMSVVRPEISRYLRDAAFIEPRFGYTVLRLDGDLLFFYDTAGSTPQIIRDHFRRLRPPELQVLFPKDATQLTSVALLNTDVGRQAPRSRRFRAEAIEDLAPDLADYAYVCTIAEGYAAISGDRFRRYVGLSRSRINDFRSGVGDFETYSKWLDALRTELTTAGSVADVFTRYATYVEEPSIKDAAHILLDIDPTNFVQRHDDGTETVLDIEDRAAPVDAKGIFALDVNGENHEVAVTWDADRGRYELRSPSLQSEFFVTKRGETDELLSVVSSEQLLRIVPRERTTIYAHGSFYKPIIPATRPGSFQLLGVLYPVSELAEARLEKGTAIVNDDWQSDCVFGLISALSPTSTRRAPEAMRIYAEAPDLVLCTDLGKEVADFVITDSRRVVFAHAKASRITHRCSASALHDVAAQAIKNLHHLQPLSVAPMDRRQWTRPWSARPHVVGETYRQRYGVFESSEDMWKHICSRIQAPDTDREVWLVLGNGLSKEHLQVQASKRRPAPEAIQVFSLLQATWGAVSQLGARLRIFCSP